MAHPILCKWWQWFFNFLFLVFFLLAGELPVRHNFVLSQQVRIWQFFTKLSLIFGESFFFASIFLWNLINGWRNTKWFAVFWLVHILTIKCRGYFCRHKKSSILWWKAKIPGQTLLYNQHYYIINIIPFTFSICITYLLYHPPRFFLCENWALQENMNVG